jgi:hypothetical protein
MDSIKEHIQLIIVLLIDNDNILNEDKKHLIKYLKNKDNSDVENEKTIQIIFFYLISNKICDDTFLKEIYLHLILNNYKKYLKTFWINYINFLLKFDYENIDIIDIYKFCNKNNIKTDCYDLLLYGSKYNITDVIDYFLAINKEKLNEFDLKLLIKHNKISLFNYIYEKLNHKYNIQYKNKKKIVNKKYFEKEYLFIEYAIQYKKIDFCMNLYELGISNNSKNFIIPSV